MRPMCGGEVWLDFFRMTEELCLNSVCPPLNTVLVIVKVRQGFLLAFNPQRNNWEIPGGHIEPGETPRQAAQRELREETNQVAESLIFEGVLKFRLPADNSLEYCGLYLAEMQDLQPFIANSEISRIILWDTSRDIGQIDAIDEAMIKKIDFSNATG